MKNEIDPLVIVFACGLLLTHGWILGALMLIFAAANVIKNYSVKNEQLKKRR